jgi:hypothetical protein
MTASDDVPVARTRYLGTTVFGQRIFYRSGLIDQFLNRLGQPD